MFEQLQRLLETNGVALGGLAVLAGGSFIGIFYKVYGYLTRIFDYIFFVNINFSNDDKNFYAIQNWLFTREYTKKRCANLMVRNLYTKSLENEPEENEEHKQIFIPGYGTHYLLIFGRPSIIHYSRTESKDTKRQEFIDIKMFCIFSKLNTSLRLLKEADEIFNAESYKETHIYSSLDTYGGYWTLLTKKKHKQEPILATDQEYKSIINDIEKFYANEAWYNERGINYKRGFLLQGPPGNGKSSGILSIAQHFKKHLYIVNLSDSFMSDNRFIQLVSTLPANSMMVIEDIDAIAIKRNSKKMESNELVVSLSTILNTLDGLLSPQNFVFFITTNHPEKLDDALMRPGRIDVIKQFDNANAYQCETMFKRFFPEADKKHINTFIKKASGNSMSSLESHLIKNSTDVVNASNFILDQNNINNQKKDVKIDTSQVGTVERLLSRKTTPRKRKKI